MKSRRPARGAKPVLARVAGYGGAVLLVVAAVVVLLMPLIGKDGKGTAAGARGTASAGATPATGQTLLPGGSVPSATTTNPAPQQNRSGQPYPSGGATGGGPQIPSQNGSATITWCPQGTAYYRAAATTVEVVITVASSGAIRAELTLEGRAPQSKQTTVRGGAPHTFTFTGVPAHLVQRVKVTTVSVGVSMQTCYARAA
ncbi:hypothetical protein [Actinomadura fibrosa]|uniref:Uncharacterized protein n=1 Tax=Actinomadura fibrosa TaxID=111802 RepID=A0ABW2XKR7_9ACTN|nr:hypothetical protein [Actinomadura fibrosa]